MSNTAQALDEIEALLGKELGEEEGSVEDKPTDESKPAGEDKPEDLNADKESPAAEGQTEAGDAEAGEEAEAEGDETDADNLGLDVSAEGDVTDINSFAAELDMEVTDLYELKVNMPDMEGRTIGELKDFYQENNDIEATKEDILVQQESLAKEGELLKRSPQITKELIQAQANLTSIEQQYNQVDWVALRSSNPAEYSALQNDYKQAYDTATRQVETVSTEATEHMDQAKLIENEKLHRLMPELKDQVFRKETGERVLALTSKYGFSQQEVSEITDSRLLRLLIDASKIVKAKETAKGKLVESKPSGHKSKGTQPSVMGRKATLAKLTKQARASGRTEDKVSAINALLN